MFHSDLKWMKFSMHSAGDSSKFSGADRNLLMSSVAKSQGLKYSWQRGLIQRETDTIISQDPDIIAKKLLGSKFDQAVFNTVESIRSAIIENSKLTTGIRNLLCSLENNTNLTKSKAKINADEIDRICRIFHFDNNNTLHDIDGIQYA